MPPAITNDQRLREMGNETIYVACIECPLVYRFETQNLVSRPSMHGLQPDPEDAPLRLSYVYIPCDWGGCESRIEIRAVRSSDTTDEAIVKESKIWVLGEVECSEGHKFPWPPYH
jgi:hypothetical protein